MERKDEWGREKGERRNGNKESGMKERGRGGGMKEIKRKGGGGGGGGSDGYLVASITVSPNYEFVRWLNLELS